MLGRAPTRTKKVLWRQSKHFICYIGEFTLERAAMLHRALSRCLQARSNRRLGSLLSLKHGSLVAETSTISVWYLAYLFFGKWVFVWLLLWSAAFMTWYFSFSNEVHGHLMIHSELRKAILTWQKVIVWVDNGNLFILSHRQVLLRPLWKRFALQVICFVECILDDIVDNLTFFVMDALFFR